VTTLSTRPVADPTPATPDALTDSAPAEWRAQLAELLAEHAIGLVHLSPQEVDAALVAALKAIGEFIGAGRASLWRTATDRTQIVVAHEWHADDAPALPLAHRTVRVEPFAAGPDGAPGFRFIDPADGRDWLAADEDLACVVLPLQVADRLIGVIRFDAPGAMPWPPSVHELLRPFGALCTSAIVAQRAIAGLEASELRHRSVLDEVADVIVRVGPDGALSYVNRAWYELTGNPIADTVGADPLANVHPEDRALAMEHMAAAIAGEPGGVREVRFLAHGGGVRWMEVKGRAVFDGDGNLAGFSGVLHDVSLRKAAEARAQAAREEAERARDEAELARDEAEQARDLAERASRAKSEFLSRMSHELRTPLNAILGFTQLLEFAELSGEDADNLSMISRAGRHLLSLINDTLDVSRIESGRLSMSLEPVPVADVAQESLDLVRPDAANRQLTLRTRGEGIAPHVVADRQRLKQVLVNLLSNAVKYNRVGGEVRIAWAVPSAETAPDLSSPLGWLRLEVSDTGLGIPTERFEDIFLPFERIGAERTDVDGSGIGLALAKNLVDAMGGRIGVRSVHGVGSTFYVDLPLAAPAVPADDDAAAPVGDDSEDITRYTVLYVEDNPSNTMLMRRIFTRRPYIRLLVAADGDTGLEMVGEHRPDLVLLDLHLPGRSGEEVLAGIRLDPAIAATPVVIVTADLTAGIERRLHEAGATDFMSKPVDIGRLLHVVDRELRVV